MSFDAEYFERFYERRGTRVYDAEQVANLARGVTGMIRWLGGELRNVLDAGAGAGFWRQYLRANEPGVQYASIDASPYACERYGHEHRDIARWRGDPPLRRPAFGGSVDVRFDLVVCQGVLPYLGDEDALRAIDNMAAMCRGFLYLEAITERDVRDVCDLDRTDVAVHLRSGDFYKRALGKHFVPVGCGLYYVKTGKLAFYELEAPT
jgi:SAM-dependent methyltransferase